MPKIEKAISFICEKCNEKNYFIYSLEKGIYNSIPVMKDRIDCNKCGYENFVYEEIEIPYEDNKEKRLRTIVVCSAIRHKHGGGIICGPRHYDKIMNDQIRNNAYKGWENADQGFVDQFGVFLSRKDALYIAKNRKQIIRRVGGDDEELFSENLY